MASVLFGKQFANVIIGDSELCDRVWRVQVLFRISAGAKSSYKRVIIFHIMSRTDGSEACVLDCSNSV